MKTHQVTTPLRIVARSRSALLDSDLEREVQAIWESKTQRDRTMFNGAIFNVTEIGRGEIQGCFVEYKWLTAQRHRPSLFDRLRVRPLGISGMIESPDGVIFGRRGRHLSLEAEKWELAPSGGLDVGASYKNGIVDYMHQFLDELGDEIGLSESDILDAVAFTLVEDPESHVFDLGIRARTNLREAQIKEAFVRSTGEYSSLSVVSLDAIRHFVNNHDVVPVSVALLETSGALRRG